MLHSVRVMVITDRALMKFQGWEYKFQDGVHRASIVRPGWHAEVLLRPEANGYDAKLIVDIESFLKACRSSYCWYTFKLWITGEGKVLSTWRSMNKLHDIHLKRGRWETIFFGLPSPKSEKSPYYCNFSFF